MPFIQCYKQAVYLKKAIGLKKNRHLKSQACQAIPWVMLFTGNISAEPLFTAEYQGAYGSMNITMVRTLTQTGSSYTLQSSATSFMASIDEVSQFSTNLGQLTANNYRYERKIFGVKKHETLDFDWSKNQVSYTKDNKNKGTQKLAIGTLDPTLYQLQLQRDLAQNPEQTSFSYTFARRNHTKTYHFKRQAQEAITFDGKNYQALVFARTKDNNNKETPSEFIVPPLYAVKVWVDDKLREELKLSGREKRGGVFIERGAGGTLTLRGLKQEMFAFFSALKKDSFVLSATLPRLAEDGNMLSPETKNEALIDSWQIENDDDVGFLRWYTKKIEI